MADAEHLAILDQGVEAWNHWREENRRRLPDLQGSDLRGRNLRRMDLRGATLDRADCAGADLTDADLGGRAIGFDNVHYTDLKAANFEKAILREANLVGANFGQAIMHNADLRGANLSETDFEGADLSGAELSEARFHLTNLRNADLSGARLSFVIFKRATLTGTQFQGASIGYNTFANCDLSRAKGLDAVKHWGPSDIAIDTIYKSKGKIPESFLRGCGVPESLITNMHSLVGAEDGIQFYSCFISHSTKDAEFAQRLHGRMRDAHLRVWFAPEDIQGGKKLHEQIETAIRIYDKLLIVLSEASLQSEWVMTELRNARTAERQSGKRKLFPVRLVDFETLRDWKCFDADSGKDLAVELREYFIPDFSNWKEHESFESAFSRLLNDLRSGQEVSQT